MPYRLEFAGWVPFPVADVFLFFANPQNLPRIMPPSTRTRIDELRLVLPELMPGTALPAGTMLAGPSSEIVTSFSVLPHLPLRRRWISRITEFEWNHYFADVQVQGPFKSWHHRHELLPEIRDGVQGTVVRDEVQYEIGFGALEGMVQTLFVGPQLRATFAYRQEVLPGLLQGKQ
jgi:ligand-binding SRPBCC domain-containing protein